jgi:hypothetical protein
MRGFERRFLVVMAVITGAASIADAGDGTCKRRRTPPNQTQFWGCVTPDAMCNTDLCQPVRHTGAGAFGSCECLPAEPDPDDLSYGTGGFWNAGFPSTDPAPGASLTFQLTSGLNSLVVYPRSDVNLDTGAIENAQLYTAANALTGTFTIEIAMIASGDPTDSLAANLTGLDLSMTSWSFEGTPTGVTTLELAPDGDEARGFWHAASGLLQFDEPVHCIATNALLGTFDYYFRPILIEASEGRAPIRVATNQFTLFATGRLEPAFAVPVRHQEWGRVKTHFR